MGPAMWKRCAQRDLEALTGDMIDAADLTAGIPDDHRDARRLRRLVARIWCEGGSPGASAGR